MNATLTLPELEPAGAVHEYGKAPRFHESILREQRGAPRESPNTTKKILLVDDDPGVREMLGRVLGSEGYEVILAKDGNEAGAKFVACEPDLVLLDLNMPGRDGWSAFRYMDAIHRLLPVIVITARPNQRAQADGLGVDALMEKPLDLPVLLEAIANLLAETEVERTRRLTNPNFKTAFLKHRKSSLANSTV